MSDKEFTIPVVLSPEYMAKLKDIEEQVIANQEAIIELKKISVNTALAIDTEPSSEVE